MLEAYDFKEVFTIREIACLALGVDPASSTIPEALRGPYDVIARAARVAANAGAGTCAKAHFNGQTHRDLTKGPLYPGWALERIPGDDEVPAWTPIDDRSRWPEADFDPGALDSWTFSRARVAEWLAGRDFRPMYDFSRRGGFFPPAVADISAAAAADAAERRFSAEQAHAGFRRIADATSLTAELPSALRTDPAAVMRHRIARDLLTPVIERARRASSNHNDSAAVMAELERLARLPEASRPAPLAGVTSGGVQWRNGGTIQTLTRKALGDRLRRAQARAGAPGRAQARK